MIDHPLAVVYAIDINAENCTQCALDLLQPHIKHSDSNGTISQAMASKTVFPIWHRDFPRHFVLVADAKQPLLSAAEVGKRAESVKKAVSQAIGNDTVVQVSSVCINSGSGSAEEAGAQIGWSSYRHSNLSCPGRHGVVPCAGEPFQHVQMEQATASARGGWLSKKNLEDLTTVVNTILRTLHLPCHCVEHSP